MKRPKIEADRMASLLRERCKQLHQRLARDGILRQGDPVQTIYEFVCAEMARKGAPELAATNALILYFQTDEDREGFMQVMREAKPGMVQREIP